jgi:hypothetical protein
MLGFGGNGRQKENQGEAIGSDLTSEIPHLKSA